MGDIKRLERHRMPVIATVSGRDPTGELTGTDLQPIAAVRMRKTSATINTHRKWFFGSGAGSG